ncbi:murein L,D-transpeptidase catalytic domain family protein [Rufibacter roseus]|uniref:Murein L,D-transpeptidase catalytic domain family protein n=2 Tax=Rufibacter roseus TaxID=1567108 RepID=A0ABW2DQ28_9BACT
MASLVSETVVTPAMAFDIHLEELYEDAELEAAGLNFDLFAKAATGFYNLKEQHKIKSDKNVLSIVNFGLSSNKKRLWVIDLDKKEVLFKTHVAHGRGSGNEKAVNFSNIENSHMSSLGFYVTENTYYGSHGLSLRLEGLDPNFNSKAKQRAIVVHGADYVSEAFIKQHGRLGRSHGCPALPQELSPEIIQTIKDGTCLYIDAPSKEYKSAYLDTNSAVKTFQASLAQSQPTI